MELKVYVIRDCEVDSFGQPIFAVNDRSASRQFFLGLESLPASVRSSFILLHIGYYDSDKGVLEPDSVRDVIADGSEFDEWMSLHKKKEVTE